MRYLIFLMLPVTALAEEVPQGAPNAGFTPEFADQTRAPALPETPVTSTVFAAALENPWGIAPLPDGSWLVTERPGRLRIIGPDGALSEPISGLFDVDIQGQGGLLDVTVAPNFADDRMVYWTYAKPVDGGTVTAAARGVLSADGSAITQAEDIFVQSPPSPTPMHYGSRIVIDGPHVFITTGEHFSLTERVLAQDPRATYGKVIRLNRDGSVPADNPFGDATWSFGHRNMQGAIMGPGGLWTIEHGPAGGDELNQPQPGANYGWPVISYGINYDGTPVGTGHAVMQGMEPPVYYWDPVIAPGGMAFYQGDAFAGWQGHLLIGSLNPGGLVRLAMADGRVSGEERLLPDVGRVRDVELMEDGSVLLLIDAADGAVLRVTSAG